jgi:two-component system KDP operon response regulator KdpE
VTAAPDPAGSRVLVVDDDAGLVRALAINLRAHGWLVTTAAAGRDGLDAVARDHPDVVVLDLGLPDLAGLDVIAGIRGWSRVPIVVLSARQLGEDKVDALDAGADDYVTKPFAMNELMARLRAAVRRAAGTAVPGDPVVRLGELTVDLAAKRVLRGTESVHLTPTEWGILETLAEYRGVLVGQRELLRRVWGPQYEDNTNYLRVYVAQLRRKLEPDPARPRYLITEPGMGYRLDA